MQARRIVFALAFTLAFVARTATAVAAPPCVGWDVEYALNATLRITDTTLGAGDGTHPIGPGRLVLRYDDIDGAPGGAVRVVDYELTDHFVLEPHYLLVSATITTDTTTRTTPDARGFSAEGVLRGRTIRWATPWAGMRSDGFLTCTGNLCGKFGAPPAGKSPLHVAPHPASFSSFELADDGKTFRMDWSVESHQDSPRETSLVSLGGRETKRICRTE